MSGLFWLSDCYFSRMQPYFPLSHGVPRTDDKRVILGLIHVIKNGLRWCDAPTVYGPYKTLYNRFVRWSRMGVFDKIFSPLSEKEGRPDTQQIDSTHIKAIVPHVRLQKRGCSASHWPHKRRSEFEIACRGQREW